jgi:hypothetical protein
MGVDVIDADPAVAAMAADRIGDALGLDVAGRVGGDEVLD